MCRNFYFKLSNYIGAATGSYTLTDNENNYVFNNVDCSLLNGVTYSISNTAYDFRLTSFSRGASWSACNPQFKVALLLHFDSNPIIDSSSYAIGMTTSNGAIISTTASKFGAGDFQALAGKSYDMIVSNPTTNLGRTSWMVDFWIKLTPGDNCVPFGDMNQKGGIFHFGGGPYIMYLNRGTTLEAFQAPTPIVDGNWHHIAYGRNYGSGATRQDDWFVFNDGVRQTTSLIGGWGTDWDVDINYAPRWSMGPVNNLTWPNLVGTNNYIDEFRFVAGFCPYTTNFTPPTAPY